MDTMKYKKLILETQKSLPGFIDRIIDKYDISTADLVGFTSFFYQNMASFAMAKRIKDRNPAITTIIGGANCEWPMGEAMIRNVQAIDFVFSGPALISLPRFVSARISGQLRDCHAIDGVFSRENVELVKPKQHEGEDAPSTNYVVGAIASFGDERDIGQVIPLDYDSFFQQYEEHFGSMSTGKDGALIPFQTSRGCWWGERSQCTFCGLNGSSINYRSMPPEIARDHIRSLFRYSSMAPSVVLVSFDLILPTNYLKDVIPYLDAPNNISIGYETKANMSDEQVAMLAKYKVNRIQPGIESLSTRVLKLMHKGTTAFINIGLLKSSLIHGVSVNWNLLTGLPGEDMAIYEKYVQDIPLLTHLPPPSGAIVIRYDRYSPYFVHAEEYKLDLRPLSYYQFLYPFDEESIANLAYYFNDNNVKTSNTTHVAWFDKINSLVCAWMESWSSESPSELKLLVKGDVTLVYDTRFGELREYILNKAGEDILSTLRKPMLLENLVRHFSETYPRDVVENEVQLMRDRGLLFEEDDRMMSLVIQ
jgi:ribosomal peptide maturation radical SAM protein 1